MECCRNVISLVSIGKWSFHGEWNFHGGIQCCYCKKLITEKFGLV